jgi:nitric oxide dioxygenase
MNHRQLELVRSSYVRIRRVRPLFADLFNRRLTLIAPALERILVADPAQRDEVFLDLIERVIAGLDRLDVLLPMLAAQARAWRLLGVEPADYDVAGMALLWTVEQVLAGSLGAIGAWRDTYELLAGVMKRAAIDPHALPPPPPPRPSTATDPYPYSLRTPSRPPRRDSIPPRRDSIPPRRDSVTPPG